MPEKGPKGRDTSNWISRIPRPSIRGKIKWSRNYDAVGINPVAYDREVYQAGRLAEAQTLADTIAEVTPAQKPDGTQTVILEVAAGTGILTRELEVRGYRVVATDLSTNMLKRLKEQSPGTPVIQSDMNESLPVADGSVDLVTILGSNRYIDSTDQFTTEVERVLAPGGMLVWPVVERESKPWKKNAGEDQPTDTASLAGVAAEHGLQVVDYGEVHYSTSGGTGIENADLSLGLVIARRPDATPEQAEPGQEGPDGSPQHPHVSELRTTAPTQVAVYVDDPDFHDGLSDEHDITDKYFTAEQPEDVPGELHPTEILQQFGLDQPASDITTQIVSPPATEIEE